ncbi:MAG: hypothetical protein JO340_08730 [Acidobacteriaceae bacterium]|nr:hypothetical protein [Acidobacteriaceae bacterium]
MRKPHRRAALLTASLFAAAVLTGCAAHVGVGYSVYDPYYADYHVWDQPEIGYYNQWVVETHRPHRDYRKLSRGDQRAYWQWRHGHGAHGEHR